MTLIQLINDIGLATTQGVLDWTSQYGKTVGRITRNGLVTQIEIVEDAYGTLRGLDIETGVPTKRNKALLTYWLSPEEGERKKVELTDKARCSYGSGADEFLIKGAMRKTRYRVEDISRQQATAIANLREAAKYNATNYRVLEEFSGWVSLADRK